MVIIWIVVLISLIVFVLLVFSMGGSDKFETQVKNNSKDKGDSVTEAKDIERHFFGD